MHYDTICPTGNQLFTIRSDMSRQRLLALRRSAATGTSLRITISDGFYTERAERSLQAPLQKCRKAAPPKKCREASTTVVLNQGGFDEVVSRVRWTLTDILT